MRRKFYVPILIALALGAGWVCSELLSRSPAFRDLAGQLSGRGHLVAIANGKGIYETDIAGDKEAAADLIIAENLRGAAGKEMIAPGQIDRELALLTAQFASGQVFEKALRANAFSMRSLREKVATQLGGLRWIEKQMAAETRVTEEECRQFYDAHHDLFMQPLRFRASHLFLAAHAETPPEVVEEKELAIATLAERLDQGESFSQLAAEISEDEATKARGGDLGFFSESRMAPEFFAEIQKLHAGEVSKPFRSHLGFHIAQVTDMKAARLLSFDEARAEISVALANERRALHVTRLAEILRR